MSTPGVISLAARRLMQSLTSRSLCNSTTSTLASSAASESLRARLDRINDMFAEARLSLQDATESQGTTYFADDFDDAKQATESTLSEFDALCKSLPPEHRDKVIAANRPKMNQLAEELRVLTDKLIHDDH